MSKSFASGLAIVLTVSVLAPSVFFIAPRTAEAIPVEEVGPNLIENTISAIENTITAIAAPVSAAANVAMQVNAYVLQPLAFILSGKLMKLLTAGVIGFVIGKANGTGVPQFIADVMKSYQTVSDSAELAYLRQINNTNSPFASSIRSALNKDYLSKTSLAGFWAQNICTLQATSPNVPAYLAGNWSQGGVAAWFALTTQVQNNPYTLYAKTQSQLAAVVGQGAGGVTGTRSRQLDWGQGFMSWCGSSESNYPAGNNPDEVSAPACPAGSNYIAADGKCEYEDGSTAVSVTASGASAVNPGDPCTKNDGTPGSVQTPGSTIKATLDKVLGGQQDKIVRMGDIGGQITSILGNIATIMNTVNFAAELLGGSDANSGLINAGNTSSSGSSRLAQLQDTTNYLGVSNANIYSDKTTIAPVLATTKDRIALYQSAWNAIGASVNTASSSVASLIKSCRDASLLNGRLLTVQNASISSNTSDPFLEQANAAQVALDTEIAPASAEVSLAMKNISAAKALVQKVQDQLNAGDDTAAGAYTAGLQTLQTMSPTPQEAAEAQQKAQTSGSAIATPEGSLMVTATPPSIINQMSLISANAEAIKQSGVCKVNLLEATLSVTTSSVIYNGSSQKTMVTSSVPGTISNVRYNGSVATPINAGTYAITADFAPADPTTYASLTAAPAGSFTIAKRASTLSVANPTVTYNGSSQATMVTSSVPGTVSNIKYNGSGTIPTNTGTYAITADFTPTDSATYASLTAAPAGDFTIAKRTPTLSLANPTVVYNGSPRVATVTSSAPGTISNIRYNDSATIPAAVGTYAITADFTPSNPTVYASLFGVPVGDFVIRAK